MSWRQRQLAALAASCRIPPACATQVEALVRVRTVRFSRVLIPATLAWIPLDFYVLDTTHAWRALLLRLALAGALLALVRHVKRLDGVRPMWLLIAVQAIGFGLLQWLVLPSGAAPHIGYGLFPYLLAAQLALFPLPWTYSLPVALAAAGQMALLFWIEPPHLDSHLIGSLWMFALIVAMSAWTGEAQLRLLARLYAARHNANHDPLTGLSSRRHEDAQLQAACAAAEQHGEPLSVLMLDADHFKRINDNYGHAGGDSVLVALAQTLKQSLRATDLAARHGGEEFLVLLQACSTEEAWPIAERIRQSVQDTPVDTPAGEVRITVSIGLATLQAGESPQELVARADAALYRAKAQGRNRCVVA